jgi:hypothetical protein
MSQFCHKVVWLRALLPKHLLWQQCSQVARSIGLLVAEVPEPVVGWLSEQNVLSPRSDTQLSSRKKTKSHSPQGGARPLQDIIYRVSSSERPPCVQGQFIREAPLCSGSVHQRGPPCVQGRFIREGPPVFRVGSSERAPL